MRVTAAYLYEGLLAAANEGYVQSSHITANYRAKILSIEWAAPKSWSEYTTDEQKSEKLIK